ncbi:hypothetical protein BGW41_005652 [Actinomortierella wolfii]|nr:hypothetical protein BGW41_005652 [Actinomortierella wolfii]
MGEFIGAGGYGNVYQAHWEGRRVAIKRFPMGRDEVQQAAAIQHEIEILQLLNDRHIIQFYGTTYHDNSLVLIMDYAEGGNLQRAIEKHQLVDWSTKIRIAREIARGLTYIHHKNVIHRDLKSMNVLLTRHMEVKLCDFGLATVKVRSASRSSGSGTLKGTFRWMAPELLTSKPKYSTKSDIYALGMVMWEMAANCTTPFRTQTDNLAIAVAVKSGEREELPPDVPDEYRKWVELCWEHEPQKRPEAHEIANEDSEMELHGKTGDIGNTLSLSDDFTDLMISSPSYGSNTQKSDVVNDLPSDIGGLLPMADGGNVEVQVALAKMYENGTGVEKSDSEAFKWYLRAATQESIEAQYKTGSFFIHGQGTSEDLAAGLDWIRKAAEKGHSYAQNTLGWAYEQGKGVDRSDREAAFWFRKSAEQGHALAQHRLAWMYKNGRGVRQDYNEALKWCHRSANQGDPDAQFDLGLMYQHGKGVTQYSEDAMVWFRKSADQGGLMAISYLGDMYFTGMGVSKDYDEAAVWYCKAADQGHSRSQCQLGKMYRDGLGVKQDDIEAVAWFRKSADNGYPPAKTNLGFMYQEGRGVKQDYDEAMLWYHRSALQGDESGQWHLGQMYENGLGVLKDLRPAIQLYRKAAIQGHAEALERLKILGQY